MSEPILIADYLLDTYCPHRVRGGEQFCIFCLRKLWDDAELRCKSLRASIVKEILEYADAHCSTSNPAYGALSGVARQIEEGGE